MSAATALRASLLAALAHPRWWVMALAAFLVRGGLVLLLLPLIPLPSTAALANALGPMLVGFVFGGPSVSFIVLLGFIAIATLVWFVLAGIAGSALDLALIRDSAEDPRLRIPSRLDARAVLRTLAVRWLAHLPTAAALVWGAAALVDAAYTELISPGDPTIPVAVRVILRVPAIVALVLVAWTLGEAVGGIATRRVATGAGIGRSLGRGILGLVRPSGLAVLLVTNLGLVAAVGGGGLAIGLAFDHVRIVLLDGAPMIDQWMALVVVSAAWIGTSVVVGVAAAWRATAWTYEVQRLQPGRTIGPDAP